MIDLTLIPKKIRRRIIFIAKRGSHTYGTNTVDSDNDYIVVYIPMKEQLLGFKYNDYKIKNYQYEVGINDIIVYSNIFFTEQLHNGNPNFIEYLFLKKEDILYVNEGFFPYLKTKEIYLTEKIYKSSSAIGRKVIHEINEGNFEKRKEFKKAMHACRMIDMCTDILDDYFTATTYRYNNWYLRKILSGSVEKEVVIKTLEQSLKRLEVSFNNTLLPEQPNINHIHNILVGINFEAIQQREIFTGLEIEQDNSNNIRS